MRTQWIAIALAIFGIGVPFMHDLLRYLLVDKYWLAGSPANWNR